MFAVIKTGGKQYRVTPDDVIRIERISGESGDIISFNDVLMLGNEGRTAVGNPFVDGAEVVGTLLEQARGAKIIVFKKKRRKTYRRRNGHRQDLSVVRITDINDPADKKKTKAKKTKAKTKSDKSPPKPIKGKTKTVKSASKATAETNEN